MGLDPSDAPAAGVFEAIFRALDENSRPVIGPAKARLLVIPIYGDDGAVVGGFWGFTVFQWLHVQMLLVPEAERGRGVGSALMKAAEAEARARGCRGAHVDTFSFQAAGFYRKLGYVEFGVLTDYPPGHDQIYLVKRFDDVRAPATGAGDAERHSGGDRSALARSTGGAVAQRPSESRVLLE